MSEDEKPKGRESTEFLLMGAGVGAIGVVGAIVGAAACPICVVATPALLGVGLYKRWRARAQAAVASSTGEGEVER